MSYRKGILDFCGSNVEVEFNVNEIEGKNTFRNFDNGNYKNDIPIITRHPNIVKGVIIGKKSWGLHVKMWTEGICEGTFTKKEILEEFTNNNITIPDSLLLDFNNQIIKKVRQNIHLS